MFTDINIYPINNKTDHISEKYIFYRKKSKTKVDIFPILGRIWSRIRIRYFTKRIRIKMKRIRNTDDGFDVMMCNSTKTLKLSIENQHQFMLCSSLMWYKRIVINISSKAYYVAWCCCWIMSFLIIMLKFPFIIPSE